MDQTILTNTLTVDEKKNVLSRIFNKNYEYFCNKALSIHNNGAGITKDSDFHYDIVHQVYIHIFENEERINKHYHVLYKSGEEKLINYINKAIYINCKSPSSNFLFNEIKHRGEISIDNENVFSDPLLMVDDEAAELDREIKMIEDDRLNIIMDLLREEEIVAWHNSQIFLEFYSQQMTLKSIAAKYGMSVTMIHSSISKTKNLLIKILKDNQLHEIEGRIKKK